MKGLRIRTARTDDAAAVNELLQQLGYTQDDTAATAARIRTWASDAVCPPDRSRHLRTRDTDTVLAGFESLLGVVASDTTGRIRCRPNISYVTNMTDELAQVGLSESEARATSRRP